MPAKTQIIFQLVSTKPFPCHRPHKMYLNSCWPNPFHGKTIKKCIWTHVNQSHPMRAKTQNVSEFVLTKPLRCQHGHKMYRNSCWPNPSQAREDTKCISSCFDQMPPMPGNAHKRCVELNITCQRGRKLHLNMFWQNRPMRARTQNVLRKTLEDTKYISICIDQTHLKPTRTQNASEHLMTNSNPFQREHNTGSIPELTLPNRTQNT